MTAADHGDAGTGTLPILSDLKKLLPGMQFACRIENCHGKSDLLGRSFLCDVDVAACHLMGQEVTLDFYLVNGHRNTTIMQSPLTVIRVPTYETPGPILISPKGAMIKLTSLTHYTDKSACIIRDSITYLATRVVQSNGQYSCAFELE